MRTVSNQLVLTSLQVHKKHKFWNKFLVFLKYLIKIWILEWNHSCFNIWNNILRMFLYLKFHWKENFKRILSFMFSVYFIIFTLSWLHRCQRQFVQEKEITVNWLKKIMRILHSWEDTRTCITNSWPWPYHLSSFFMYTVWCRDYANVSRTRLKLVIMCSSRRWWKGRE